MVRVKLSGQDVKRGTIIKEPGWYPVRITKIEEKDSKDKESTNVVVDLVMTEQPYVDVPLRRYFSEKAIGMMIPFIEAVTGAPVPEDGGNFDLAGAVDKTIEVYVDHGTYEGRMTNVVEDFRAVA